MNSQGEEQGAEQQEPTKESLKWRTRWKIEKREGDWTPEQINAGEAPEPYEVDEGDGNVTTYGGASALLDLMTGGGNVTPFNNANAYLGIGNSSTAADASQTDLQGTNVRRAMDSGYPQHTDGTSTGNATATFKATYPNGVAEFAWNEWGLFNASSGGRMFNRRVISQGTKPAGQTWTWTIVVAIG